MKLSVIIVNYNVRFFLEQCLHSVFLALKNVDAEVFVVDNNSVDGSVSMVKEKFPTVTLIENDQNLGFSVANNIAIRKSTGEYVLLLNPDTVVEEDTFINSLAYMESNNDAGALGVKMIDGKGNFLPESKRGLPTPWVAFYKMFGITKLFPKSRKFGRYHLSFLDKDSIHNIDVLCGAFMMIRKKVLDRTGLLDETFFMYGEDIDLSYRIQKAGFRIVYFPHTTIIHYKGESTRKSSLNYVFLFYKAMQIFAQKHLQGGSARWLNLLIQMAIYFRASLSIMKRIGLKLLLPALDILFIYAGIAALAKFWGKFWFGDPGYYSMEFYTVLVPLYLIIWILSLLFAGAYDHPIRLRTSISGIFAGTLIILLIYALLPKEYHYSRVVILLGAILAITTTIITRISLSLTGMKQFTLQLQQHKKILIAGSLPECERVKSILKKLNIQFEFLGFVSLSKNTSPQYLGTITQLGEIVKINKVTEIIFCSNDIPSSAIINCMLILTEYGCDFKIAPANSDSIIGSNSINTAGDLYVYNVNSIASVKNRRLKRTFDFIVSMVLLVLIPIWIWQKKKPGKMLKNIFDVLFNRKTWIGYTLSSTQGNINKIKSEVFKPGEAFPEIQNDPELIEILELTYARNYKISNDLKIMIKAFIREN